jgi:acyl carrier protein
MLIPATPMDASLLAEIKALIVTELNLEGRDPSTIDDHAPLFGPSGKDGLGLGLDSLDALELAMSVEERFGVRIPEGEEARPIFGSAAALAAYVARARVEADGAPPPRPNPVDGT